MQLKQHQVKSLTLFCKVIDNFGDIGICWRLARQLKLEHRIDVTLWVDDLASFKRICPEVAVGTDSQQINGVRVRHWHDQAVRTFTPMDVTDIVIEFFGCEIPASYIAAMAQRVPHPVWLNLEGLSAEEWVEGCHTLPSPHPSSALIKYFYFPGFTNKTGGLLLESELLQQSQSFQEDPAAMAEFLGQFGVTSREMDSLKVSLFCYPQAPVEELFAAWQSSETPVTCLVPEGVAQNSVQAFFGEAVNVCAGASKTCGALTVRVLPFVCQQDYDKLLCACDFNIVRGEDSFVRAQWAGRPFIWHIYPQDKNLHHVKLKAFLQRCTATTDSLKALTLAWNAATENPTDFNALWQQFTQDRKKIAMMCRDWQHQLVANGDLATNLLKFSETVQK